MSQHLVDLTVALSSYDHTRELTTGEVAIAGTRPSFIDLPAPEAFRRFVASRDWDVSELSLVEYAMLRSAGVDDVVAIPVFTSRMFRHGAIYVRHDRIAAPADLRGARVGISGWASSAGVWARGMLADMHDVDPWTIEWWQGGVDRPGRPPALDASGMPDGFRLHEAQERSLEEMLWAGDLDAIIAPRIPTSLRVSAESGGAVRRLFEDVPTAERAYFERTGCLPPLLTIAVRRDVLDRHPWIATNLYRAFEVAKRRYFVRLTDISASRTAIPWAASYVAEIRRTFGPDPWPYGVAANRQSLDLLLRYCGEQGLLAGELTAQDLFVDVEPFVDDAAL